MKLACYENRKFNSSKFYTTLLGIAFAFPYDFRLEFVNLFSGVSLFSLWMAATLCLKRELLLFLGPSLSVKVLDAINKKLFQSEISRDYFNNCTPRLHFRGVLRKTLSAGR